jgi:8-oxo-dGTP pyrophosphatase MutT (NUDIX family)/phosphohistidine phosphatase SixA
VSKPIRAAGGVVWRSAPDHPDNSAVEVAVVHRPRYDDWSIPKGKLATGESELDGALREVFEETGCRVRPGRALGEVRYLKNSNGEHREKVVHYWAMQAVGGVFTPSREVDQLLWLSPEGAQALLTRSTDREVLGRFSAGPALTGTVLLVRHASAGSRSEWRGDDRVRPLDEVGREQAQELVRLLSRFEVQEIVCADFLRCIQTVKPLGDSIGLEVKEEPLLSEQGFPGREQQAVSLLRKLGDHNEAVAACSQRLVIPELIKRLADEDGFELPDPFRYKKGSFWALSFDGRKLCSVEYFPPPAVG